MIVCGGFLALFVVVVPIVYPLPLSGKKHAYPYCEYCEREFDWTERAAQDGVTLRETPAWICRWYSLPGWCKITVVLAAAVSFVLARKIFSLFS